jgi:signal peptidase I
MGQLFLGKRRKAIPLIVVFVMASAGFWPLRLPRSYPGLLLLAWLLLPLSLFAVYDALFGRDATPSERLSRWWILPAIPIHYIGFNILFTLLLFGSGFRTARNLGSSMEPALSNNERFVYDTACYRSQAKRRGDIVIMHYRNALFIKRIVAIGGDTIEGKQQQILLNGQPLSGQSIWYSTTSDAAIDAFGPVTIPAGKYFVLGDNMNMSLDSRTPGFGLVDANAIVGKALYSYQFISAPLFRRLN